MIDQDPLTPMADTFRIILGIPLYTPGDQAIAEFFEQQEVGGELDTITGLNFRLITYPVLSQADQFDYGEFFRFVRDENDRYGIRPSDLPCLFLEEDLATGYSQRSTAIVKLPPADDLLRFFRIVASEVQDTIHKPVPLTAQAIAQRIVSTCQSDGLNRVHARGLRNAVEIDVNGQTAGPERVITSVPGFARPLVFLNSLATACGRVVRVERRQNSSTDEFYGVGTGFLVGPDLVLTCKHNLAGNPQQINEFAVSLDYQEVTSPDPENRYHRLAGSRRILLTEDDPLLASSPNNNKQVELSQNGPTPDFLDYALFRLSEPVGKQKSHPDVSSSLRGWFTLPQPLDHSQLTREIDPDETLLILGHPQMDDDDQAEDLKLTFKSPSFAVYSPSGTRLRYRVDTEIGNSGSPVMNGNFEPLALHHYGMKNPSSAPWLPEHHQNGFNQAIPLELIAHDIKLKADPSVCNQLGLTAN